MLEGFLSSTARASCVTARCSCHRAVDSGARDRGYRWGRRQPDLQRSAIRYLGVFGSADSRKALSETALPTPPSKSVP
jgi:hypothetical protein